jgi:hypothetical protein
VGNPWNFTESFPVSVFSYVLPRVKTLGARTKETAVIVVGVILLLIGFIAKIPILWGLGILVLLIGLVLLILGAVGREVGGRKHYY